MKITWNSLIQPHLDYGSVLVAPTTKGEKSEYEKPLRSFTRMASGMKYLSYWERLEKFRVFSNERRTERYKVTYIWKSLNGLVPSLGL